jgi:hypothetical protein
MRVARTLSFFWIASLDKPRPVSFSLKDSFTGDAGALARCWGILATRREWGEIQAGWRRQTKLPNAIGGFDDCE